MSKAFLLLLRIWTSAALAKPVDGVLTYSSGFFLTTTPAGRIYLTAAGLCASMLLVERLYCDMYGL